MLEAYLVLPQLVVCPVMLSQEGFRLDAFSYDGCSQTSPESDIPQPNLEGDTVYRTESTTFEPCASSSIMLRLTLMKVAGGPVVNPRLLAVVLAFVVYYLPVVYSLQRLRVTSGPSRELGLDGGKRNFGWANSVTSIGRRPCPQFQPPLVQGQCSSGRPGCDKKMQMPTVEENQYLEGKLFETLWMTGYHQRPASTPSKKGEGTVPKGTVPRSVRLLSSFDSTISCPCALK